MIVPLLSPDDLPAERPQRDRIDAGLRPDLPDDRPQQPGAVALASLVSLFYTRRASCSTTSAAAAAIACVLLTIILVLSAVQFRLQTKWVHYE